MNNYLILLMSVIPVIAEIIFDKWRWANGKDDKPLSTWLRLYSFVQLAVITGFMLPGNYLIVAISAGFFFFFVHLLLFNPLLNIARADKTIGYRKKGEMWTRLPYAAEYLIKLIALYVSWVFLFHLDWILTSAPSTLIEYFQF